MGVVVVLDGLHGACGAEVLRSDAALFFVGQQEEEPPFNGDGEVSPESPAGALDNLFVGHFWGIGEGEEPLGGSVAAGRLLGADSEEGLPSFVVAWQWLVFGAVGVAVFYDLVVPEGKLLFGGGCGMERLRYACVGYGFGAFDADGAVAFSFDAFYLLECGDDFGLCGFVDEGVGVVGYFVGVLSADELAAFFFLLFGFELPKELLAGGGGGVSLHLTDRLKGFQRLV